MNKQYPFRTNSPVANILNIKDLAEYFSGISVQKVDRLILLCCCIYLSRTTNLSKCADEVGHLLACELQEDSCYQLLIRFFKTGKGEAILLGIFRLIVYLLWLHGELVLLMDRTTWHYGKHKIVNLLVIGAVYKGVLIPLVWQDLDKAGNSSTKERLDLVDKLLKWWSATDLSVPTLYIVGDREFIGTMWLVGLQSRGLYYVMRIRGNRKYELWHRYGKKVRKVRLSVIRRWLSRHRLAYAEVVVGDCIIANLVIEPLKGDKSGKRYLYLITNIDNKLKACELYALRWKIETCFKHLKSNGFNLEDMVLSQTHKVNLMFGVLALVYTLAVREGALVYENKQKKVPLKTYKNGTKALKKSVFRKGLTIIKRKIYDLKSCLEYLQDIINIIQHNLIKNKLKHIIQT